MCRLIVPSFFQFQSTSVSQSINMSFESFPAECILKFLTIEESKQLASVNNHFSNEVCNNTFHLYASGHRKEVEYEIGLAFYYMKFFEEERVYTTKKPAEVRMEELKKDSTVEYISIFNGHQEIEWERL